MVQRFVSDAAGSPRASESLSIFLLQEQFVFLEEDLDQEIKNYKE